MIDLATTAAGVTADELGFVARLLVAPSVRRSGIGRLLVERAAREANGRGLVPVLDVVTRFHAAIALYERMGWQRLGAVTVELPNRTSIEEFVYLAPAMPSDLET